MTALLEARDLFHIYHQRGVPTVALKGANITMFQGSWISVMGPSGSGKSTLLHVLAAMVRPSAGTVHFEGIDFMDLDSEERCVLRRRRLGVVLQRDNLHPLLSLEDNVALPLRLEGCERHVVRNRVAELLGQLGLLHRRHARPGQVSGGEAQRGALAVALAASPAILLADEPTGELDSAAASDVMDLLTEIRSQENVSIFTVTHDPEVAERADRAYLMRDGVLLDA